MAQKVRTGERTRRHLAEESTGQNPQATPSPDVQTEGPASAGAGLRALHGCREPHGWELEFTVCLAAKGHLLVSDLNDSMPAIMQQPGVTAST